MLKNSGWAIAFVMRHHSKRDPRSGDHKQLPGVPAALQPLFWNAEVTAVVRKNSLDILLTTEIVDKPPAIYA
jgi:hypothetical protein